MGKCKCGNSNAKDASCDKACKQDRVYQQLIQDHKSKKLIKENAEGKYGKDSDGKDMCKQGVLIKGMYVQSEPCRGRLLFGTIKKVGKTESIIVDREGNTYTIENYSARIIYRENKNPYLKDTKAIAVSFKGCEVTLEDIFGSKKVPINEVVDMFRKYMKENQKVDL